LAKYDNSSYAMQIKIPKSMLQVRQFYIPGREDLQNNIYNLY
jgi:hypothetical protein